VLASYWSQVVLVQPHVGGSKVAASQAKRRRRAQNLQRPRVRLLQVHGLELQPLRLVLLLLWLLLLLLSLLIAEGLCLLRPRMFVVCPQPNARPVPVPAPAAAAAATVPAAAAIPAAAVCTSRIFSRYRLVEGVPAREGKVGPVART
jgi:hypothetical protein